jgi:hypothetical protein
MTRKQAFELSIEKWKLIIENNGYISGCEFSKEIKSLRHKCGLCEKYLKERHKLCCRRCPINPKITRYNDIYDTGCSQEEHPFNIWSAHQTKANAQAVLNLILSKQ